MQIFFSEIIMPYLFLKLFLSLWATRTLKYYGKETWKKNNKINKSITLLVNWTIGLCTPEQMPFSCWVMQLMFPIRNKKI